MAAMTGGDAVPRWAWLVAAILLLIPVFAIYKIVETRAALNTAEAGRQSALNALASTEAALAAANKQLADFKSAQANSDTELQAALQSRQKLEADARSASTQLGARQQLAAMERRPGPGADLEQRRPSCRALARARRRRRTSCAR